MEVAPGVTFYTNNTDFNRGGTFEQSPLYSVQAHVVHGFKSGIWMAIDGTYYSGRPHDLQQREGRHSAVEHARRRHARNAGDPQQFDQVLRLRWHVERTGTTANSVGIAWQYRWGGGY